jgi:hypothetical protein
MAFTISVDVVIDLVGIIESVIARLYVPHKP